MPKTTYKLSASLERKSAPPKITQPRAFALNTDRRGTIDRKKLPVEEGSTKKTFKSRPMPSFPEPTSPQRSSRSFEFKGTYCLDSISLMTTLLVCRIHTAYEYAREKVSPTFEATRQLRSKSNHTTSLPLINRLITI